MKKLTVVAALLAASFGAYAQDYKPVAGNAVVELGLVGGLGTTTTVLSPSAFGTPQVKVRYFLADQLAARVGFNWSQSTTTNKFYGGPNGDDLGTQKIKGSIFMLNLGIEKHFAGTERLSTYVGADLLFRMTGVSEKNENYSSGPIPAAGYAANHSETFKGTNSAGTANSTTGFGLRAVTGADYYFIEKVYLGAEIGWGFIATSDKKASAEITDSGTTTTTNFKSGGGSFDLAPAVSGTIRLGFRF